MPVNVGAVRRPQRRVARRLTTRGDLPVNVRGGLARRDTLTITPPPTRATSAAAGLKGPRADAFWSTLARSRTGKAVPPDPCDTLGLSGSLPAGSSRGTPLGG